MNIPNLPTDNLYKFIAIFGLILFIFRIYQVENLASEINSQVFQLNESIRILKTEKIYHEKNKNFLDNQIKILCKKLNYECEFTDSFWVFPSYKNLSLEEMSIRLEIDKLIKDYRIELQEFDLKTIQINSKSQQFNLLNDEFDGLNNGDFLQIFGFVVAVMGFTLWYFKIQRFQDEILENKVETELNLKSEKSKSEDKFLSKQIGRMLFRRKRNPN